MTRTCAHPTCRTSLDEHPIECPHGQPFCEHCTWEDGCEWCDRLADLKRVWDTADDRPTWDPADIAAGAWAEQRKEEAVMPHMDPREDDRAADRYYERRWA